MRVVAVNANARQSACGALTPAKRDVVRLVSEGLSNKAIAAWLFVSLWTVQSAGAPGRPIGGFRPGLASGNSCRSELRLKCGKNRDFGGGQGGGGVRDTVFADAAGELCVGATSVAHRDPIVRISVDAAAISLST